MINDWLQYKLEIIIVLFINLKQNATSIDDLYCKLSKNSPSTFPEPSVEEFMAIWNTKFTTISSFGLNCSWVFFSKD